MILFSSSNPFFLTNFMNNILYMYNKFARKHFPLRLSSTQPVDVHVSSLALLLLLFIFVILFVSLSVIFESPLHSQSVSRGEVVTCKGEESRLGREGGQMKE